MDGDWRRVAADLFEGLLRRTHLSRPSDVGRVIVEEARTALQARASTLYWVNREETALVPLAHDGPVEPSAQHVDATLAGRCFTGAKILVVPPEDGVARVLLPVVDGTDRLGVLELCLPAEVWRDADGPSYDLLRVLERFAHATAMSLASKRVYGDTLELAQRSRPMDLGAELLWSTLPPMTFATEGLVIAAMLEPAYENGGDAFDYAVNDDAVHLAIFDGLGHGLTAARLSTFVLAAYRHARRRGLDLAETYAVIDAAIDENFGDDHFVTGVVGRLDHETGVLEWVDAGHPPPLLVRDGRMVKLLQTVPSTPFGVPGGPEPVVGREQLEPGDVLLMYTDGVTEARRPDGTFLDVEGLVEYVEHESAAQRPAPETLRRFKRTLISDEGTVLGDDATVLLVEWRRDTEHRLVPQTVMED
jgi:serine phosphatase RsbU (regulator of sigma subunit)